MHAAIAGMKMGQNHGHVATATAPSGWKKNWPGPANRFWKISIHWRAIRRLLALPTGPWWPRFIAVSPLLRAKRKMGMTRIYIS